jgi:uncharacterized protein (TIGR03067 family)
MRGSRSSWLTSFGLMLMLAFLSQSAFAQDKPDGGDGDKEAWAKLDGKWKIEKATLNGDDLPAEITQALVLTIKDKTYHVEMPTGPDHGPLKIDTSKSPYQMDIKSDVSENLKLSCIFKFEDEKLVICYHISESSTRPEKFESTQGSNQLLATYVRAKEEKKDEKGKK